MSGSAQKTGNAQTAQVVTLLNQLGDRMVRSEHERLAVREEIESTREILSHLENRAEQAERIFLTIQDNISKKESAAEGLLERQEQLEQMYRDSAERLKRAEALTSQIEEAIAVQNRLAHRLEKTAEDKVRILNKIERIEAAVEETRKSLNSGALVGISIPQPPANDPLRVEAVATPWWKAPYRKQAATFSSLVIAGLLCGVAISQLMAHWPQVASQTATPVIAVASPAALTPPVVEAPPVESVGSYSTTPEDLAAYGEDSSEMAMDTDPDALAATLNAIEPGRAADVPMNGDELAALVEPKKEPQLVAPPIPQAVQNQPVVADPEVDAFIASQTDTMKPLNERIKADAALSDVIKKIETKAFDGIPEAQHDLAAIYTAGHGGVPVDYNRAALWFKEAAINGVANARYNLGVLYHQGLGAERDVTKAIGWYRAAAQLGHPEAQYNLGIAAIEGIGTAYNPRQAATYFEKAARGGVMEAAYNLGLIHENGLLGDADMNEAIFWYSTAANHNPEARVALNQVMKALGLKKSDVERVVKEYGALYKLNEAGVTNRADIAPVAPVTEMASANIHDPAALAKIIPPLSSDESRNLLNSVRKDQAQKNQAQLAQVQEQLTRLGLYGGAADGLPGPQTEDAIRSYQSKHDMVVTGKASQDLLSRLLASEGENGGLMNVGLAAR